MIERWSWWERARRRWAYAGRISRALWPWAYGVRWRWIVDREWRNADLFQSEPWHCAVCGGEWLPREKPALSLYAFYGHFAGKAGQSAFVPYEEGEKREVYRAWHGWWTRIALFARAFVWIRDVLNIHAGPVYGWWTPGFGGLWYPGPGLATNTIRDAHAWHFIKIDPGGKGDPMAGMDCMTGETYRRKKRPRWLDRSAYSVRRAWAIARGAGGWLILRAIVAWCRAWYVYPTAWARVFRGLPWWESPAGARVLRRLVPDQPPWGFRLAWFMYPAPVFGVGARLAWVVDDWAYRVRWRARRTMQHAGPLWRDRGVVWRAFLAFCREWWDQAGGWPAGSEPYFLCSMIRADDLDEGPRAWPRPGFSGLDAVIRSGYEDAPIGEPCPPIEPPLPAGTFRAEGKIVRARKTEAGIIIEPAEGGAGRGADPSARDLPDMRRAKEALEACDCPPPRIEVHTETCATLEDLIGDVERAENGRTISVMIGGQLFEAEVMEGGALRVRMSRDPSRASGACPHVRRAAYRRGSGTPAQGDDAPPGGA